MKADSDKAFDLLAKPENFIQRPNYVEEKHAKQDYELFGLVSNYKHIIF